MLAQDLVEILACPKCKGVFDGENSNNYLLCSRCKLKFPVRNGIPILMVDEAEHTEL